MLPTDYGYTGQRSDASSGLDYYGARYYDPTLGQFTSADTLLARGLNRYGYVGGNPTTATDPSGHMDDEDPDEGGVSSDQGMTPEAMSGDVSPGGPPVAGDGDVSPLDPNMSTPVVYQDDEGNTVALNGDETVTITYPDGHTETMSRADYDATHPTASLEPTEMGENAYNDLRAQEGDTTTSTTPTTQTPENPSTPNTPQTPENSNGGDSGSADGSEYTSEDLYAFGGSPNGANPGPRGPRASTDIDVNNDGMVSAQNPTGEVQGASTYTDPAEAPLSGHYYRLPAGTRLPNGLSVQADGEDVGGPAPWGHRTIYPTQDMPFESSSDSFVELFRNLGWNYGGKK